MEQFSIAAVHREFQNKYKSEQPRFHPMYRLFFISDKVCRPFEKIWLYCTDEYKKQARLLLTAYINLCGYCV